MRSLDPPIAGELFWSILGNLCPVWAKWPPTNYRKGVRGSQFRFSLVAL